MENYNRYQSETETEIIEFPVPAAKESAINSAYPVYTLGVVARGSEKLEVVGMLGLLLQTWECLNVLLWLAV